MTTNIKFKGNKSWYYPLGINEKNGVIPCTRIAQNFTSEEIVKDHEKDSYFFRSLEKYGIKLNERQIEAVRNVNGPVITLAGAGSGKTSVLTSKVGYMMNYKEINPANIMILTFTKKAAEEMKSRISDLPGLSISGARQLLAGTFHSIFLRVIRNAGINQKIISSEKMKHIAIKNILRDLKLADSYEPETIVSMIGYFKNHMIKPSDLPTKSVIDRELRDIYAMYEQWKEQQNMIDFDDILVIMYDLLTTNFKLRELIQEKIKYILVDEFQDSSSIQYAILQIIAAPHNNITIVGDDWQSIYAFRGANPGIILNFPNDYSKVKKVILDTNYRSNPFIVGLGNSIIKQNKKQFHKTLNTNKENGSKPKYFSPDDSKQEATMIVNDIIGQIKDGNKNYRDFSILYRTHAVSRSLIEQLVLKEIPFVQYKTKELFYNNSNVKPIINVLKLAIRPKTDFESLKGVCPMLYIGKDKVIDSIINAYALDDLEGQTKPLVSYLLKCQLTHNQNKRAMQLYKTIKECRGMSAIEAIQCIRNGYLQYEQYLLDNKRKNMTTHKEMLLEELDELETSAKSFSTIKDFIDFIEKLETQYEKMKELQNEHNVNAISLMTIHGSKGLEFKHVYIIGASEGTLPHKSSLEITDDRVIDGNKDKKEILQELLEEERRLLYVAVTRAKDYLHIYSPKSMRGKDVKISRFLKEAFITKKQ
ncbi:ATP-dependent helicase [Bacillus cereus]|uniref:ATP-dependent helicase n=1 Tax=Bacillus cereus TaxID=1396 RepID=UPI000BF9C72A|nr:ATP-dependent helicase [Bacillus cereus]PFJ30586.1 DNA helicase UvrD [Bacillus anthracis]PGW00672.1 DNA helicase UvrD [Bacillus cereus]